MPTLSGPSEILRAYQKDEEFQTRVNPLITEIIQEVIGVKYWLRYRDWFDAGFGFVYRCLTTLSNFQTLGEEYTGIVQVNQSASALPKKHLEGFLFQVFVFMADAQLLMIILNTCGTTFVIHLLCKLEKYLLDLPESDPEEMERRTDLLKFSIALRNTIPYIMKFHRTLFYFNGVYYEISKRLCGIKYAMVRFWRKDTSAVIPLRILAIFTAIELAIFSIIGLKEFKKIEIEKPEYDNLSTQDVSESCPLCLNNRQHTSITPCGHLFCWSCIHNWLQKQNKCPLCRTTFQPSRVVYLQNYSITP